MRYHMLFRFGFYAALLWAVLPALCPPVCRAEPAQQAKPLRVQAWVGYMPEWLTTAFTRETGIPVRVTFFSENENLYRSVAGPEPMGAYDLITPSGEMAQRMAGEGLLMPLPAERMPNTRDVAPWLTRLAYDKGNAYSLPLLYGILGLVIDTHEVPPALASRITGYKDLWLPELAGKIMLPNDFRSTMSFLLLTLGYSVNEQSPERLKAALDKLATLVPAVAAYDSVDQEDTFAINRIAVAVCWGMERFADKGGRYRFVFPVEGSPLWVDAVAVPKNAHNPEAAYAFINFLFRPDNLARFSRELGYAVAGQKAVTMVPQALRENPAVYPPENLRHKLEAETMLPESVEAPLRNRWNKLKSGL